MKMYQKTSSIGFIAEKSFPQKLVRKLDEQRKLGEHCDITLTVGKVSIPAHGAVLSAYSDYFKTMFSGDCDFKERGQDTLDMSHVFSIPAPLQAIIEYMYVGRIVICEETLEEILNGASLMLLEDLRHHCARYITSNLGPKNCLSMWAVAEIYSLHTVAELCKMLSLKRFHDDVIFREETLDIPEAFLKKILKHGIAEFVTPLEFLQFLLRWKDRHDLENSIVADIAKQFFANKAGRSAVMQDFYFQLLDKGKEEGDRYMLQSAIEFFQGQPKINVNPNNVMLEALIIRNPDNPQSQCDFSAYIPEKSQWVKLNLLHDQTIANEADLNSTFKPWGFLSSGVLFQKSTPYIHYVDSHMMFATNEQNLQTLPRISVHLGNVLETSQYFCFDKRIFSIVRVERRETIGTSSVTNVTQQSDGSLLLSTSNYMFLKWELHQFNQDRNSWVFVDQIWLPKDTIVRHDICHHVLVQKDRVFAVFIQQFLPSKALGRVILFLMSKGDHGFKRMSAPDNVELVKSIVRDPSSLNISGSEEFGTIFLWIENVSPMLVYHIDGDWWSETDGPIIASQTLKLPIKQAPTNCKSECITSPTHACVYDISVTSPYVCKLSAFDLTTNEWQELSPPPFDSFHPSMHWCGVFQVPLGIIQKAEKYLYQDTSEEAGQSHWFHFIPAWIKSHMECDAVGISASDEESRDIDPWKDLEEWVGSND